VARIKRGILSANDRRLRATTLGDLAAQEVEVFCWCNRCSHNAVLPTRRLIAEMGPAMPVPEVGARLRCSGCASKDIATRPAWPSLGQVTRHD
jgi:hypothetical protein